MVKVIFIPGNSGATTNDNWFPYLKKELEALNVRVVASEFPDNDLARESYWIPFLKDNLQADECTILVGYSSGAIASMRFAESHRVLGSVLVGAYHTDLGMLKERQSGYFSRPWNWEAIRSNQKWVVQFASVDDPWIPVEEARCVHEKLGTEYHEYHDQGHFGGDYKKLVFPELFEVLKQKVEGYSACREGVHSLDIHNSPCS